MPDEDQLNEDQFRWFKRKMFLRYRKMRGLTQVQVGEGIYRSPDSVRNYELGRAKIPAQGMSDIIRVLGMPEDVGEYMRILAPLRGGEKPIEADERFNALYLSLCEEYMGEVFEWASTLLPATLQTADYYEQVVSAADINDTEERREAGLIFRKEREQVLVGRQDDPAIHYLIGEAAFFFLSKASRKVQIDQLDALTAHAELPGWELRVLQNPNLNAISAFSSFSPGDPERFPDAGPKVVYTELPHSSWVLQDDERIAPYDGWRHAMWLDSIGFKEYRDAYWRDRLA